MAVAVVRKLIGIDKWTVEVQPCILICLTFFLSFYIAFKTRQITLIKLILSKNGCERTNIKPYMYTENTSDIYAVPQNEDVLERRE